MGKTGYCCLLACCLSFLSTGCSVPYFASVRGPIRGVRVLDAESGEDIPGAKVALTSQTSARYLGPPPCSLVCPDLCEIRAGTSRGVLLRNADLSFHASSGLGMGSWGFFTGRPEDPNEYPRGVVVVDARGYRPAMLRYTVGRIEPGWSCVERSEEADVAAPPGDVTAQSADQSFQGDRCELGNDGVLRFHLRRLGGEGAAHVDCQSAPSSKPATERSSSISGQ
jgi:hypothetical protein